MATTPTPGTTEGVPVSSAWWGGATKKVGQPFGVFENVTVNGVNYSGPHSGIDVPMPVGTELTAPVHAVVQGVGKDGVGNNFIRLLLDNGNSVLLLHLQDMAVHVGQDISPGTLLGHSGSSGLSTGPHLHFEVQHGSTVINPWQELTQYMAYLKPDTTPSNNPLANVNQFFGLLDKATTPKNLWKTGFVSLGVVLIGVGVFIYFFKEEAHVAEEGAKVAAVA